MPSKAWCNFLSNEFLDSFLDSFMHRVMAVVLHLLNVVSNVFYLFLTVSTVRVIRKKRAFEQFSVFVHHAACTFLVY